MDNIQGKAPLFRKGANQDKKGSGGKRRNQDKKNADKGAEHTARLSCLLSKCQEESWQQN